MLEPQRANLCSLWRTSESYFLCLVLLRLSRPLWLAHEGYSFRWWWVDDTWSVWHIHFAVLTLCWCDTEGRLINNFFIPAALSRRVPLPATSTLTPDYLLLSTTVGPEYFSEPVVFIFTSVKKFNEYFSYYQSICTAWVSVLLNYRFFKLLSLWKCLIISNYLLFTE